MLVEEFMNKLSPVEKELTYKKLVFDQFDKEHKVAFWAVVGLYTILFFAVICLPNLFDNWKEYLMVGLFILAMFGCITYMAFSIGKSTKSLLQSNEHYKERPVMKKVQKKGKPVTFNGQRIPQ